MWFGFGFVNMKNCCNDGSYKWWRDSPVSVSRRYSFSQIFLTTKGSSATSGFPSLTPGLVSRHWQTSIKFKFWSVHIPDFICLPLRSLTSWMLLQSRGLCLLVCFLQLSKMLRCFPFFIYVKCSSKVWVLVRPSVKSLWSTYDLVARHMQSFIEH